MNPVKGWGSIATENGYVIIEPLSARPRYRVVYPEGVIVRSAADIDDSDFVRVIAKGEVVEGTGQVQMFDNVERVQVRPSSFLWLLFFCLCLCFVCVCVCLCFQAFLLFLGVFAAAPCQLADAQLSVRLRRWGR